MNTVVCLNEALEDLKSWRLDYLAQENASTAANLSRNAEIDRSDCVFDTREIVMSDLPYILVYQITDRDIHILAVILFPTPMDTSGSK